MNACVQPVLCRCLSWSRGIVVIALFCSVSASQAAPLTTGTGIQGIVVLAEHRFDPALQRYMAEQSLAALPLRSGKLYYVFPIHNSSAQLEGLQIQYLESLLEKRAEENRQMLETDEPESD